MKKGCVYCDEKRNCPEVFSEKAEKCGAYNHEEMPPLKFNKEENNEPHPKS